jgi:lauroyl/myristoyl acyltransferase
MQGVRPRDELIVPDMFHTSPRLRHVERWLRPLPRPLSEAMLATVAVSDALLHPRRFRQARAWASAQPGSRRAPWRLAFALLANHGRFCGEEALVGMPSWEALGRDAVLEGAENLPEPGGGAILLGFHLGPPRTWLRFRALGYPVHMAGGLATSARDARWESVIEARDAVRLTGKPRERLVGLYQIRELVRQGSLVYLTADGPFGREAFRVDLPGGPLILRQGWLALRRLARVPTIPVLAHRRGNRYVITVHPPLPPTESDPEADIARCRAALAPLVEAYVRQFPEQCRYLAFPLASRGPARVRPA